MNAPLPIRIDELPAPRRSLRIAVVTETYPPEVNGVALTLARAVDGLRERNHELQLIRPRQGPDEEADRGERFHEVLMRGLPIPRYPQLRMGLPATRALLKQWTLRRPDIVHIATEGPLGWSALQAAHRLKLPISSDFRTNFHAYSRHYGIGWLKTPIMAYLRKFHNRAHCTMVPTEALRGELARSNFRDVHVVPRGVDTQLFNPGRRSAALRSFWGAGDDVTRVALYVGRLAHEKNLGALVTAFEAMARIDPRLKLVLVGDGPARRELERRCPGAVFAGQRIGTDLAMHYASADMFLFPSLTETFGNVTPEAMASGLPVLAFDCAAAAQLIRHGENGLLAPPQQELSFVHLARQLAADPDAARVMGACARVRACMLDWNRVVAMLEDVMLKTIHASLLRHGVAPLRTATAS